MNAAGQTQRERVLRIVARLIERTNADDLVWERAAIPNSWAVNVGQTRFRARIEDGERPLYFLDIMGPLGEMLASSDAETAALLASLYAAAASNGNRHTPDPLNEVEEELGLGVSDGAAPSESPRVG